MQIICIDGRYGVFSFVSGFKTRMEPTLLEWARKDFDACFNYLFRQGLDDVAEELFDRISKTVH